MSIESYFTNKKQMIVTMFNQFQQSLAQLSIAIQLQIDKQYFNTKNLLQGSHTNLVQKQLNQMKNRQPEVLIKVVQTITTHFKNQINTTRQSSNSQRQNPLLRTPQRTADSSKVKKSKISISPQKQLNNNITNLKEKQISNQYTLRQERKQDNQLYNNTHIKNNTLQVSKQFSTDAKNDQQRLINENPVQLLNKVIQKRSNSSSKFAPQQNYSMYRERISNTMPKRPIVQVPKAESQLNKKIKMSVVSRQDQNENINQATIVKQYSEIQNPYSKELQNHQQTKMRRSQTQKILNRNMTELQNTYRNPNNFEDNHYLYERLDLKIQQSALEILNKVRQKRSPTRRKHAQVSNTTNKPLNTKSNGYAILNISKQSIPWGGQRVQTEARYS